MALSARLDAMVRQDELGLRWAARVKTSAVVYWGALMQFDALTGHLHPYGGTEAEKLAGWAFQKEFSITGDTTASDPDEVEINSGPLILANLAVTGLSGTYNTDLGLPVWATDDGTYTVNDPGGTGARIGIIIRPLSSSRADVAFKCVLGHVDTYDLLPTPTPSPTPTPTPTPT